VTAELHGPLANKELVGKAIAGRRQDVLVATKFGVGVTTNQQALDGSPPTWSGRSTAPCSGWGPSTSTSTACTASIPGHLANAWSLRRWRGLLYCDWLPLIDTATVDA
jgi:hypothetical protein